MLVFLLAFTVLILNCRPSSETSNNTNTPAVVASGSPPFSTKEPQRYRATRTITFTELSSEGSVNKTGTRTVVIMRDGVNRREEYEADRVGTIVFLETAAGRFVILPQARLYASTSEANSEGATEPGLAPETMSPDFLLHESTVSSEYQKLGEEVRAGRMTTKYRVINRSANASISSETVIWVDERLGMPIASESATTNAHGTNRVSMELREISTEVESGVFALSADYRKVAVSQIFSLIRGAPEAGGPPAGK